MPEALAFFGVMLALVGLILAETAVVVWAIVKIAEYTGENDND